MERRSRERKGVDRRGGVERRVMESGGVERRGGEDKKREEMCRQEGGERRCGEKGVR